MSIESLKRHTSGVEVGSLQQRSHETAAATFRVDTWEGVNGRFAWACAAAQGRRKQMEDTHAVDLDIDGAGSALFGVFDGHAGSEVAAFCARRMASMVARSPHYQQDNVQAALEMAFLELDAIMTDPRHQLELFNLREGIRPLHLVSEGHPHQQYGHFAPPRVYQGPRAGCTACVAIIRGGELSVASVGDSRCLLARGGRAYAMTRDHKPSDPREAARVEQAGLSVVGNRVAVHSSSLAMTRALGDTKYKNQPGVHPLEQAVIAVPDTKRSKVDEGDSTLEFLLMCCDGVFESLTSPQAVEHVRLQLDAGASPRAAAVALIDECLRADSATPASRDNITVLVVQFLSSNNDDGAGRGPIAEAPDQA